MKRNVGPAKALAVILSASLALSPSITAAATSGDDTAALLGSEQTESTADETGVDVADEAKAEDEADAEAKADAEGEVVVEDQEAEKAEDVVVEEAEKAEDVVAEEAGEVTSDKEKTEEVKEEKTEDAGELFRKVDPKEEGLENLQTAIEAEVKDIPVEEKDPDEQTRVIIVMEGDSVLDKGFDTEDLADNSAAMNLSDEIIAEQEQTVEKISEEVLDGEELDVNYNLSIITNAVSADVAYKDIENIVKVDGVAAVYVAQKYEPQETAEPMTITSGDMVGSYTTWAAGYTGAGTRIAVIDTGIDADHPSFDEGAFAAHLAETAEAAGRDLSYYSLLSEEEIASVLPNLNVSQRSEGVSASDLYLSEKIPFAFNYVDKDLDVTHDNDEEGDHGTHVSGIATANYYVPGADGYQRQDLGVVGIAPDAQLITMKVFGKDGGAYSDDYMAAIEDALLLKADVVNLSLGSSAAGYSSDSEAYINEIFEKLEGTSTVVSISAGNSGRWSDDSTIGVNLSTDVNQDTVGSPGSYLNAFTVASAVNSGFVGNYFSTEGGNNVFYTEGSDSAAPEFTSLDVSADGSGTEYSYVFFDANGQAADYEGVDVTDKIVFVQRGAITFAEKQMNAEAAGAKAVVIYNNAAGTIGMTLQGSTAVIPAVSITLADGIAIASNATQVSDTVYEGTLKVFAKIGVNTNVADGYTMSTFSSYGVPGTLDLKPEITAPGGNIYSTRDNGTYGLMSGTSMAAPSVSGQSALVEQYIRETGLAAQEGVSVRTLAQSLLMSTATPLREDNDPSAPEYSPRSQGAGLANVYNAVSTPAYVLVGEKEGNDGKVKVVLGDDPERLGNYSFSFDVYNLTDEPQYYVLDSSVMTEQLYEDSGISYFAGTSHVLNPAVSLQASDTQLVYDLNNDGKVNKNDRTLFLKAVNGTADVAIINEHEDYFDLNSDGVVNTKDVYLFGKQLKGAADVADLGIEFVRVEDSTKINVQINLSDSDREYLAGFENGMYVDGFIYVKGGVDLSVPFLAFYGSWMDSSMYEPFDFMASRHDSNYEGFTYVGLSSTNFLTIYPNANDLEGEYYYIPNLYITDAKYIPDRNAITSSGEVLLGSQYYSLIRNANRVIITIKDKNTGEEYFKNVEYENYAEFSYNGQWKNYMQIQDLFWAGTDAEGNPLPDGTEVEVILEAVPSYYDNVEDPSTLTGKGLYLKTPIAIDNEAPAITGAGFTEDGKLELTITDNRYTAAVIIYDEDGNVVGKYAVNQEEKGADVTLAVDMPGEKFFIVLADYAFNEEVYTFNLSGSDAEDPEEPEEPEEPVEGDEENKDAAAVDSSDADASTVDASDVDEEAADASDDAALADDEVVIVLFENAEAVDKNVEDFDDAAVVDADASTDDLGGENDD